MARRSPGEPEPKITTRWFRTPFRRILRSQVVPRARTTHRATPADANHMMVQLREKSSDVFRKKASISIAAAVAVQPVSTRVQLERAENSACTS